jgi:anti-sigma-K factor RskA
MIRAHDESMLELAALRAIDALEAAEAAIIDQHMAECEECRAEFARSRAAWSAFAFAVATPPPAALRDRVLRSAVKIRRIRPWWRQTAVTAAAAAAVILIAAGTWFETHRSVPSLQAIAKCTASGLDCGTVMASGGVVHLDAHNLPVPPQGKVYQAWIIHPKRNPIPEPTFTVSQSGDASLAIQATANKGDVVAVTVEPQGGSQAPTSKPVLVATL